MTFTRLMKSALVVGSLLALVACETKVSSPVVRFQRQLSYDAVQPTAAQAAASQQMPVEAATKK